MLEPLSRNDNFVGLKPVLCTLHFKARVWESADVWIVSDMDAINNQLQFAFVKDWVSSSQESVQIVSGKSWIHFKPNPLDLNQLKVVNNVP